MSGRSGGAPAWLRQGAIMQQDVSVLAVVGLHPLKNGLPVMEAHSRRGKGEEVDKKLHEIMLGIFHSAYQASQEFGDPGNLVMGANVAGFLKVADAMKWQGVSFLSTSSKVQE